MSTPSPEEEFDGYQRLSREHNWPAWAATALTSFARVPNITQAAADAGVHPSTIHALKRRSDPFLDAMEEARTVALDRLETTIFLRATVGTPVTKTITKTKVFRDGTQETTTIESEERHLSDTLAMFYLKRWRTEYREGFGLKPVEEPDVGEGNEERVHEAAKRFRAEVIRLADRRPAADSHSNGSG